MLRGWGDGGGQRGDVVVTAMTGICIHSADSNLSVFMSVVAVKALIVSQQTRYIKPYVCTLLGQRRWANSVPTLGYCLCFFYCLSLKLVAVRHSGQGGICILTVGNRIISHACVSLKTVSTERFSE